MNECMNEGINLHKYLIKQEYNNYLAWYRFWWYRMRITTVSPMKPTSYVIMFKLPHI